MESGSETPRVTIVTGWVFVIAQFTLLGALMFLPAAPAEAMPDAGRWLAVALQAAGGILVVTALVQLGSSATATPVPTAKSTLRTSGLYSRVRHPIYTGLCAIALGLVLSGATGGHAIIAVAFVVLMNVKARFEEALLQHKYESYADYMARTGRFFPRIHRG